MSNWLDDALDVASTFVDSSDISLFETDLAEEGISLLRKNSDVLAELGKETLGKTLILRSAGDEESARAAVLDMESWDARQAFRAAARQDALDDNEESSIAWDIVKDFSLSLIRVALPFILAAIVDD